MGTPAMVSPTSPSWVHTAPALTGPGAVGGGAVGGGGVVVVVVVVLVDLLVDGGWCDAVFVLEPQDTRRTAAASAPMIRACEPESAPGKIVDIGCILLVVQIPKNAASGTAVTWDRTGSRHRVE